MRQLTQFPSQIIIGTTEYLLDKNHVKKKKKEKIFFLRGEHFKIPSLVLLPLSFSEQQKFSVFFCFK